MKAKVYIITGSQEEGSINLLKERKVLGNTWTLGQIQRYVKKRNILLKT